MTSPLLLLGLWGSLMLSVPTTPAAAAAPAPEADAGASLSLGRASAATRAFAAAATLVGATAGGIVAHTAAIGVGTALSSQSGAAQTIPSVLFPPGGVALGAALAANAGGGPICAYAAAGAALFVAGAFELGGLMADAPSSLIVRLGAPTAGVLAGAVAAALFAEDPPFCAQASDSAASLERSTCSTTPSPSPPSP